MVLSPDALDRRNAKTGDLWLFSFPTFQEMSAMEAANVLIIIGPASSGKSTFAHSFEGRNIPVTVWDFEDFEHVAEREHPEIHRSTGPDTLDFLMLASAAGCSRVEQAITTYSQTSKNPNLIITLPGPTNKTLGLCTRPYVPDLQFTAAQTATRLGIPLNLTMVGINGLPEHLHLAQVRAFLAKTFLEYSNKTLDYNAALSKANDLRAALGLPLFETMEEVEKTREGALPLTILKFYEEVAKLWLTLPPEDPIKSGFRRTTLNNIDHALEKGNRFAHLKYDPNLQHLGLDEWLKRGEKMQEFIFGYRGEDHEGEWMALVQFITDIVMKYNFGLSEQLIREHYGDKPITFRSGVFIATQDPILSARDPEKVARLLYPNQEDALLGIRQ
jgi:hypothetical protein